jgi:ADP-ribosylglycohydrolase
VNASAWRIDRIVGCIVGGAIGDALGGPYEGQAGPIELDPDAPWRLSDETQLTLATCEAITQAGRVSPEDIAAAFADWYRTGRIHGVGASTLKALRDLSVGGHWALAGRSGERAAGNGAAMRVAPLAFVLDPADDEARRTLRDICRITHHHDEAYAGGLAIVAAVRAVIREHATTTLIADVAAALPDTNVRDWLREMAAARVSIGDAARRWGCSGYVAESVPLAILAASHWPEMSFAAILTAVIEAGGDADTNASMAGQILGAAIGFDGLPGEMVARLPDEGEIRSIALPFAEYCVKA